MFVELPAICMSVGNTGDPLGVCMFNGEFGSSVCRSGFLSTAAPSGDSEHLSNGVSGGKGSDSEPSWAFGPASTCLCMIGSLNSVVSRPG